MHEHRVTAVLLNAPHQLFIRFLQLFLQWIRLLGIPVKMDRVRDALCRACRNAAAEHAQPQRHQYECFFHLFTSYLKYGRSSLLHTSF